ncbi:Na+/H+ antiporter NhaA [Dasania sp. GY-MA-18]|uniref:Na(+)/H(+) antiporter NhaA n=1 Tax=Dasania phycosphaerae TaxID=2950436 RepID=A0A9J6RLX3_9GAMM|nr:MULTISPECIES: Na+/H+ antiporter NhaA [Dasania]MCR8922882.1 Na+/H+ antiporter NhaA [Dasania sp. GY-MA-18]MCZ0865313.1 Na+/H+ antiporter NhaA [Dasania phycosphaerae]MCZ0869038.1 Na+/H+ antiporter NhaA [Dasania phycosphaerae]
MIKDLTPIGRFGRSIQRFIRLESTGGLLLIAATLLAMAVKNSTFSDLYIAFLNIPGMVQVGALSIEKPLFLWVNDGWMAIFFFVVGLEIKYELLHGHLSDRSQLVLPLAGAVGGVAVPAIIYLMLNWHDPVGVKGWAVPTATDIAFALGVLAAVGSRVPVALKVFLMTLAILDDLIAIVIIALFYTSGLSLTSLVAAAIVLALMLALKLAGTRGPFPFIILGAILWVCVLKSGVHATLAGVITAFFISTKIPEGHTVSPAKSLIEDLHPWVAFVILPMFALVNAGVSFEGLSISSLFEPVPLGITLGLFIGKPIGVMLCVATAIMMGLARLPTGVTWMHLFGVSVLCGVGFTMSLFIGGLAFAEGGAGYARIDRLGILFGSGLSAVLGYLILVMATKRQTPPA